MHLDNIRVDFHQWAEAVTYVSEYYFESQIQGQATRAFTCLILT